MSRRANRFGAAGGPSRKGCFIRNPSGTVGSFLWERADRKPAAMAALALAKNREVQYGAALALAIAGDSSQAQALTNDLERSFPEEYVS